MQKKLTILIYVSSLITSLILFEYYSNIYRKMALVFPLKNTQVKEATRILEENFRGSFTQLKQINYTCFQANFIKTQENKEFIPEALKQKLIDLGFNKGEGLSDIAKKECPFELLDQMKNRHFGWIVLIFFNFLFSVLLADFIIKLRSN